MPCEAHHGREDDHHDEAPCGEPVEPSVSFALVVCFLHDTNSRLVHPPGPDISPAAPSGRMMTFLLPPAIGVLELAPCSGSRSCSAGRSSRIAARQRALGGSSGGLCQPAAGRWVSAATRSSATWTTYLMPSRRLLSACRSAARCR